MPRKAHLNGSKRDPPKKAFLDPKNVIFLIFQFWPLYRDPGIATLDDTFDCLIALREARRQTMSVAAAFLDGSKCA